MRTGPLLRQVTPALGLLLLLLATGCYTSGYEWKLADGIYRAAEHGRVVDFVLVRVNETHSPFRVGADVMVQPCRPGEESPKQLPCWPAGDPKQVDFRLLTTLDYQMPEYRHAGRATRRASHLARPAGRYRLAYLIGTDPLAVALCGTGGEPPQGEPALLHTPPPPKSGAGATSGRQQPPRRWNAQIEPGPDEVPDVLAQGGINTDTVRGTTEYEARLPHFVRQADLLNPADVVVLFPSDPRVFPTTFAEAVPAAGTPPLRARVYRLDRPRTLLDLIAAVAEGPGTLEKMGGEVGEYLVP